MIAPAEASAAPVSATVAYAPVAPAAAEGGASALAASSVFGALESIDAAKIPSFVNGHSAQLGRLLTNPPGAADVSRLWRELDPVQQSALLKASPHVVGNLEGIPYDIRGKANALDLRQTISGADHALSHEHGRAKRIAIRQQLTALGNVQKALKAADGVSRTLVSLDPSSDTKAAIVVGDLSTAHYVSVLVPGMYMAVGEQITDWSKVAQEQYGLQTSYLKRLTPQPGSVPGVAVVAWIGYQTPMLLNIGGLQLAQQGADSLERTLEGIQSIRAADPPYLSVFAHSYGSTAALMALERHTVTVDALALMGSPGSDAQSVSDLAVRGGNVFVGAAPLDPIAHSAFFGSDPGSPSYGAKPMGVGGAADPLTHQALAGSSGHNEYFTAGTECMRNLALIGIDRAELVLGGGSKG